MKKILIIVGLLSCATVGMNGFAKSQSPAIYRTLRPLGMGNAFIAVSDDQSALMYNPAGLNDIEQWRMELSTITLELSSSFYDFYKEYRDLQNDPEMSDDPTAMLNELADLFIGAPLFLRISESIAYSMKNFGMRIATDGNVNAMLRNAVYPSLEYDITVDNSVLIGGSYGFFDKALQVGVAVKPIYRLTTGAKELTIGEFENYSDSDEMMDELTSYEGGMGVGVDVGVKSHLDSMAHYVNFGGADAAVRYLRPTIGLTWQDIGNTRFTRGVESIDQTIGFGSAVHLDFWKFKNTLAVDIRDMNTGRPFVSMLAMGLESWLTDMFALRCGLYQLRPSAGFTIDLTFLRLDGAIYKEEVSQYSHTKGDLRAALQFGLGF